MGDLVKGPADYLVVGDNNARCSICGAKEKASKLVRNWKGLYRHPAGSRHGCNEPRQPQDFVRAIPDIQTPPWVQKTEDNDVQICTWNSQSAIVGWAGAGCAVVGRNNIFPVTGYFAFNTTGNVAGQTSGQITTQILFQEGTYSCTFSDGEKRNVTFAGLNISWTPALASTPPGLYIDSLFTNIGTY
jgi:hypothetical protein